MFSIVQQVEATGNAFISRTINHIHAVVLPNFQ